MKSLLTASDVEAIPAGTRHVLQKGTLLTPAAVDRARQKGITLVEAETAQFAAAATQHACKGPTCGCSATPSPASPPSPPSMVPRMEGIVGKIARGPTPELWKSPAPASSAPGARPADALRATSEARDTHLDGCFMGSGPCEDGSMVVVTAVGKNRPRVLAEIAGRIADLNGDIHEISQRVVNGYFHTILTVDTSRASWDFAQAKAQLEALSKEGDYKVSVQHERVFQYMHRI